MASAAERPAPTTRSGSDEAVRSSLEMAASRSLSECKTKGASSPGMPSLLGTSVLPVASTMFLARYVNSREVTSPVSGLSCRVYPLTSKSLSVPGKQSLTEQISSTSQQSSIKRLFGAEFFLVEPKLELGPKSSGLTRLNSAICDEVSNDNP